MADLNTKTDRVYYVLQMNLKCAYDEVTKSIESCSVKYAKNLQEEKTHSFEWFVSVDGKEGTLIGSISDNDGAKQRVENL